MVAACQTDKERVLILFTRGTGFRKGEIVHSGKSDIHFTDRTVRAQSKPRLGFRTKDCEERTLPVNDTLIEALKSYRTASFASSAIGSNSDCALIVHERANFRSGWMSPLSAALIASRYFARASPSLIRLTAPQVNAGWPTLIKSMSAISRACLPLPFGKG